MKKTSITVFVIVFFICGINSLSAQFTFSGILDSTVSMNAGAGDSPPFLLGLEEYANIRFQTKMREAVTINGSVNLLAVSGSYAKAAADMAALNSNSSFLSTSYTGGENFAAAIELERLYFRLNGEHIDFDFGLMRIPFGYGQLWGPSDFLNPRNPIKPDARPRAVLGTTLTWYPLDELKLLGFYAAPRNSLETEGKGSMVGMTMDYHWDKASIQALYSFEIPNEISSEMPNSIYSSKFGIHRAGLSLKADIVIGLVIDALYTYNHEAETGIDGLALTAGFDYSFLDGDLIVLAEYLYSGDKSSTSFYGGGSFFNNHYLYTGITYNFNSFTSMSVGLISCFDDISFMPTVSVTHQMYQGVTLIISAQAPMDRDLFNKDGNRGELGPIRPGLNAGSYFNFNAKVRIRF